MHNGAPSLFKDIESKNGRRIVHFAGIGGIGMSALAQWFLAQNWAVSGSDIASSGTTRQLQKLGIKVKIGHKKGNIPRRCALVVHSQAIKPANPEMREAHRLKIPVLSYPQAVGRLTERYATICVAGMHGKSTTTALAGLILKKAGPDPTVIIGTKLKEFRDNNFRSGKSDYLVLEADEYGGAFLNYSPAFTIATNIDREHLDYYKNIGVIKKSFLAFFSRTKYGGALILNRDSAPLLSLKEKIERISREKKLLVSWYSLKDRESKTVKKFIRIAGTHNVSNALAAFYLSRILKIPSHAALNAIGSYRGAWRRMEYRGKYQVSGNKNKNPKLQLPDTRYQIPVYDDYAHHPTEIKATLQAFRQRFPRSKVICVFQPHQAERLKKLFKEFQTAFDEADIALILPIYRVAGRDPSTNSGQVSLKQFDSEKLVKAIQKKQPKKLIFYLKSPNRIKKALAALLHSPSPFPHRSTPISRGSAIVVMMGAGDIVNYTRLLLKK